MKFSNWFYTLDFEAKHFWKWLNHQILNILSLHIKVFVKKSEFYIRWSLLSDAFWFVLLAKKDVLLRFYSSSGVFRFEGTWGLKWGRCTKCTVQSVVCLALPACCCCCALSRIPWSSHVWSTKQLAPSRTKFGFKKIVCSFRKRNKCHTFIEDFPLP